jgi:hypothetical protein
MFAIENMHREDAPMSTPVTRREILITATAIVGAGCYRTVTKHKPDGQPYDAQEPDATGTVLAILLVLGLLGALAAASNAAKSKARATVELDPSALRYAPNGWIQREGSRLLLQIPSFKSAEARPASRADAAVLGALPQRVRLPSATFVHALAQEKVARPVGRLVIDFDRGGIDHDTIRFSVEAHI